MNAFDSLLPDSIAIFFLIYIDGNERSEKGMAVYSYTVYWVKNGPDNNVTANALMGALNASTSCTVLYKKSTAYLLSSHGKLFFYVRLYTASRPASSLHCAVLCFRVRLKKSLREFCDNVDVRRDTWSCLFILCSCQFMLTRCLFGWEHLT